MNIKIPKYCDTSKVIDKFITKSKFVLPAFLLLIFFIFEVTFTFWNFIAFYLDIFLNYLFSLTWIENILINAIFWWIAWVIIFLPNIIILYFFLFWLKESWILPRIAYVFDRYLKKIGLSWNSFMSLFMWFGCTIPATLSARNIENKKERILAVMMLPFISCSAKIPIFVLFTSIFIASNLQSITLIFIYIIWILLWILSNYFLSKILKHKKEKLIINLPKYKLPRIKNILKNIWSVLKEFIFKVGIYIIPFSIILSLAFTYPLNEKIENTYWWKTWEYIQVIFEPLGFTTQMSIAVISWFIWKEITVSTLGSLYYIQDIEWDGLIEKIKNDESITFLSAISFLFFILLYSPCIWAIITAKRVLWNFYWFIFFIYPLIFAWIVSFIIYNLLNLIFSYSSLTSNIIN